MSILNAAIWLGAGIFFTVAVVPAIFSNEMRKLLGENSGTTYYVGGVAMVIFKRFFTLQYVCGAVALMHLFAEGFYLGRPASRPALGLLGGMFCLGLLGAFWLQPKMQALRQTMYSPASQPEQSQHARHSFGLLHGTAQTVNLFALTGLVYYLARVTRPPEAGRYTTTKFRH